MATDIEQVTVKAKIHRWRNLRSGWMVVQPGHLAMLRNKFLGGVEEVAAFDTSQLQEIVKDPASDDLRLRFSDPQGQTAEEIFSFASGKQSVTVNTILDILQNDLVERRKQQEEKAAQLEKERQEQQKKIRENFASALWETSGILWLETRATYSMVQSVIVADWEDARRQYSAVWQQADKLKLVQNIDLKQALAGLDEGISSRSGQEVIRRSSNFLTQLAEKVQPTEAAWSKWKEHKDMLLGISPNWNHLPYFLLFSCGYCEALLSARIEDWAGLSKALPRIQSSGTVLQNCFVVDWKELLDTANRAAGVRDLDLFMGNARNIENALLAAIQAKPFKFEPDLVPLKDGTNQLPEVENHGQMPQQS